MDLSDPHRQDRFTLAMARDLFKQLYAIEGDDKPMWLSTGMIDQLREAIRHSKIKLSQHDVFAFLQFADKEYPLFTETAPEKKISKHETTSPAWWVDFVRHIESRHGRFRRGEQQKQKLIQNLTATLSTLPQKSKYERLVIDLANDIMQRNCPYQALYLDAGFSRLVDMLNSVDKDDNGENEEDDRRKRFKR